MLGLQRFYNSVIILSVLFVICGLSLPVSGADAISYSDITGMNSQHVGEWLSTDAEVAKFKSILFSPSVSDPARCAVLNSMTPDRLMIFHDELLDSASYGLTTCGKQLITRENNYVLAEQKMLDATYKAVAHKFLRKCSNRISSKFGPEKPIVETVSQAAVITGSYLPHCDIAFSFDDGPHPQFGPQIVKILQEQDIHANFFSIGERIARYPSTLLQEYQAGNVMGTHTWSHPDLQKLSPAAAEKEIESAFDANMKVLHAYTPYFRFPYGAATKTLRAYLLHFSRVAFFWNIDTEDWKIRDPQKLYQYALQQIDHVQRGIVLMHEIHQQSVIVLPYLIESLREAGYQPVVFRPAVANLKAAVKNNVP